jgi:hypothetical protein
MLIQGEAELAASMPKPAMRARTAKAATSAMRRP